MSLAPTLGGSIASSVPVTTANANDYPLIDVTAAVGEWLNGSQGQRRLGAGGEQWAAQTVGTLPLWFQ